jgi:uncharacterized protein YbgA (DUF1722 family)/uncharacterized protein YbbK (DUF523 family)
VDAPAAPIRVGVSACLLGRAVRFDGGHKRDPFLTDTFGRFVEWVPVCPEEEAGFGTPRESMRLVDDDGRLRLITTKTARDLTDTMRRFSTGRVEDLASQDLSGYVLKKDSPSCGVTRVKVYGAAGVGARTGQGLFAAAVRERLPLLPMEDEGRLCDPRLRENFIERVFAYRRLTDFFSTRWTVGGLVRFHTAHKLTLMAHRIQAYQELGRLVATAKARPREAVKREYSDTFMHALEQLATVRRHTNVLQHMAGYVTPDLDPASRVELLRTIEDYRLGLLPLVVPMTLVRHHVRRLGVAYLLDQVYLEPHPKELGLRNHV